MKTLLTLLIVTALTTLTAFYGGQTPEQLVFTTSSFKSSKTIKLDGIQYSLTVKTKCKEGEPPQDCWTKVKFSPDNYSELKIHCAYSSFASADINQDGVDELIVLSSQNNGTWTEVYVFAIDDKTKAFWPSWYQPIEPFMYWPGTEGDNACDARIFWLPDTKQVKVLTTDIDFNCNDQKIFKWTTK